MLEHCSVRGIANKWFKSHLSNSKKYVSINGNYSNLASILCSVPRGSVLGPLLFLMCINDLNQTIKFCKVHNFADDVNLLHFNKWIVKHNIFVNGDTKNLVEWLNAYKISQMYRKLSF